MALNTTVLPNYDPNQLYGLVRSLSGPVLTGDVILNTLFGGVNGAPLFARWLWVGTTGNITYVKYDGTTQTLLNAVAGVWHPILAIQVNSSGTTAANMAWGS